MLQIPPAGSMQAELQVAGAMQGESQVAGTMQGESQVAVQCRLSRKLLFNAG